MVPVFFIFVPMHRRWLILFSLITYSLAAAGQVELSGFARNGETGQPVPGASIQVQNSSSSFALSDSSGFFSISVPSIPASLVIRHVSYELKIYKVNESTELPLNVDLLPAETKIREVTITAPVNEARDNRLRKIELRSDEIDRLTSGFGEADIIKTLQSLPGIQKSSEINAALNVRGTGHGSNMISLDGQPLHNSYHLLGIAPMFNPDVVESTELRKSGFHSRSGNALSSFLLVKSRDPDLYENSYSAYISNLSGGFKYAGPVLKGKLSVLAAARYSFFDLVSDIYENLHGEKEEFIPLPDYKLYDIFLKLHFLPGNDWQGDITLFKTTDLFRYNTGGLKLRTDWGNSIASLNMAKTINGNSRIRIHSGVSAYNFSGEYNPSWNILRENDMLSWDSEVEYYGNNSRGISWQAGAFSSLRYYYIHSEEMVGDTRLRSAGSEQRSLYTGLHANLRFPLSRWLELAGGLRLTAFNNDEIIFRLAPRFQVDVNRGNFAMNLSYDRTYQFDHLINPLGFNMPADLWYPAGQGIPPRQADQYAVHFHYDFGRLKADAGGFYKRMKGLTELSPGAELISFHPVDALATGRGEAYGFETGWHLDLNVLMVNIYYTWSKSTRYFDAINDGEPFSPSWDLPHQVDIKLEGDITGKLSWNATWFWASGQVTTMPTAYAFLPHGGENRPFPLYTELYNFRMPPSHRMDIALQYRTDKEKWSARLNLGVYNVYHNSNPYFLFFTLEETEQDDIAVVPKKLSVFPFTPFASLKIQWK